MSTKPNPVVFIHGLWIHASAWQPWMDLFADRGYTVSAPGWPGDGATVAATRDNADALNDVGIAQIVDHYADLINAGGKHETKPVIVGHSFGGLIAQELLAAGHAAAAVAIDPAPIKGVKSLPLVQLRSALPVLGNPANRHRTVTLNAKQFRFAFGNALTEQESDELHRNWTIPGPGRPLFEDATANFVRTSPAKVDTHLVDRGPLLLTSGTEDHTVPVKVTREVYAMYAKGGSDTEFHEFEGRGHSLTIDNGWRDVADVTLGWLARKGF
ncbi:alpha/beta hydrolase [Mycolicibacterium sp. CH28]|uniref:alpha/beta hydrolase n=1 Tax=Mycolicibacterium sp. CH28 TaxID=2512237 RepID=UPI001081D2B8|nr:alpha/beta hydrolase [Mycolicibacterium sp. CH28]TGD84559.1 alpha/beta hydrolase [Mycolicibacterium sp. CH28]